MKISLVLVCFFTAVTLTYGQSPKFDWIHRIGDAGDDVPGQVEVDSNGNLYLTGTFLGEIILGNDTLKSVSLSTPASFLAKFDPIGNPIWARKLPVSSPSIMTGPTIKRMRLSPGGKIYMLGSISSGSYIAVFRKDGSMFNYAEGAWNATWNDVDFDSLDNAYLLGSVAGSVTSLFVSKYDSLAYKKWEYYYSTQENLGRNIKIADGKVNVFGQFKGQIQLTDTVGSSPITLNAANFNAIDLFTATYNLNGKLLSGATAPGIPPVIIGGGPEYSCDISPSQGWYVGWIKKDAGGNFLPNLRRHGLGFANSNTPVIPFGTNCPFTPVTYTKNSRFKNEGVLSWMGFLCSSRAYTFDSTGTINDSLILPSVINTMDFSFNKTSDVFVTAEFNGSISYQDNTGLHTLTSKANTNDIYVGKYHTCQIYSPTITKSNDTLQCSLSGLLYQWFLDNNPISGANSQLYKVTQAGNYHVVVSDSWNCKNISPSVSVSVGIMPIVKEGNISIYPNPVNSILLIDGIQGNTTITVYDLAGKMLSTINTSKDFELNVSDLQIGMYFIKIGSNTLKFIKE